MRRTRCQPKFLTTKAKTHQVIRCFLETGQHEYRILHLLYTESSDTQDFTLVSHDISKQHDVTRIDRHSVRRHCMLNLVINRLSCSFNTENIACFHDVIRSGLDTIDTYRSQHIGNEVEKVYVPSVPMTSERPYPVTNNRLILLSFSSFVITPRSTWGRPLTWTFAIARLRFLSRS
jgi:hypothetical protein